MRESGVQRVCSEKLQEALVEKRFPGQRICCGFSRSPGEMAEGIGGKGEEFHDQHVGKVWRFEEGGGRKGGSGMDSSEESLGMKEIGRIGRIKHGGIDKVEDCRKRSEGCKGRLL